VVITDLHEMIAMLYKDILLCFFEEKLCYADFFDEYKSNEWPVSIDR